MNTTIVRIVTVVSIALVPVAAHSQDTAFVEALRAHASAFTIDNGRMHGAGADAIAKAAREHQFILVGEDHGIRELPEFVGALWDAARPAGYSHIAVEIGPITAKRLESMLRAPDGQASVNAFLGMYTPYTLPFFFWKEESQMLERIVKSIPRGRDVVWGLDQEFIMSPTYLLERLTQLAPNQAARAMASRFADASAKGDKAMLSAGNPRAVWMVSATDADVAALKTIFHSAAPGEASTIIDELAVSRDVYGMFNKGANYESNQKRADLMKQHFMSGYRAAQAGGEKAPKAIVKLGANHVFRGPSITNSYEMGSFLPELALLNNDKALGILVIVAKGTWNAFRPFGSKEEDKTRKYDPLTTDEYTVFDIKSVLHATGDSTWTFVDLRPLRGLAANGSLSRIDPRGRRLLNSFDAVVVVPEGHASVYFR